MRLSSAGDVLLTSPLLKIMKTREPASEIHYVVKERYSDLIRNNPNVSRLHLVQNAPTFYDLKNLHQKLLEENFDTTLDLHNNFRSIYLRKGTSKDVGVINKEIFKRTLLVKTKLNLFTNLRSAALKYAQVYDNNIADVPLPEIFPSEETKQRADELWRGIYHGVERVISLCPGAKHFTKRWPLEYWIELAKNISTEVPAHERQNRIVLIGGEEDKESCEMIARSSPAVNFCGKLTLLESVTMLSYADLVITNDSFLMHAANALGKKIVAIFGSSVREFGFFPYGVDNNIMEVTGLNCRPCSHIGRKHCPKKHFRCMMATKPEAVYRAATGLLK